MALTGLSPTRRTPGVFREFVFAAGPGSSGTTRDVLIYGNKTSAGSETNDVIGTQILDKQDCIARFGRRSEVYNLWKLYNAVDKDANVYAIAVAEGGGAAAGTCTITFANGAATAAGTWKLEFQGESVEFGVSIGDTAIQQAANCVTAFNNASGGEWMATAAVGGSPNDHIVTVTNSQLGPRLNPLLTYSLRITSTVKGGVGTTATKGSPTAGTTEDDFTTAYAQAANGEFYYQVNPKFSTSAPTSSDNGVGEGIAYLRDQNLPINGKAQTMHFGLTGTQAQATTVATDSDANSVLAYFYHAENSDWTAGMIAAHMTGIVRSQQIAHPAANITGYHNSDRTLMLGPPDPYTKSDRPTSTEVEADLCNGVTPIAFTSKGDPYIVRHVTSYSEVSSGVKDYRASEGHTASVIHFAWDLAKARWNAEKQPFIADDPPQGAKPLPKTSTPGQVKALLNAVIDDLTAPRPLGLYEGPILSPSPADVAAMRDSIVVTKVPGGFHVEVDWLAVEHNLKSEWTIRQTNAAY